MTKEEKSKLEKYIEILTPEVEKLFGADTSGHNTDHLTRTMKAALYIAEKEQCAENINEVVVGVAAYLHDVHRFLQSKNGKYFTPKESLPTAEKILRKLPLTETEIEQILYCIEFHEVYNWNDPENCKRPIEALIVQDADNLDAIGAIGIVRCFNFGTTHGIPWHNPNVPFDTSDTYNEDNGFEDASSLHHFYHKLFKLGKNMNTKTGKKLANERISFMKTFTNQMLDELDGKF